MCGRGEEMLAFSQHIWQAYSFTDIVFIKTLFSTGVRVSELVNIRLQEVDLERCQIRTRARSNSRPAIVSGQDRPIHIAGLVGGQEGNHGRELLRLGNPHGRCMR